MLLFFVSLAIFVISIVEGDVINTQNSGLMLLAIAPPGVYIIWSFDNLN